MFTGIINYVSGLGAWGIFVQLIGFGGAACEFISYQQKTQKRIMLCQALANALWMIHMWLIGGIAASVQNMISISRGIVYSYRADKKWAKSNWWHVFFILLSGLFTYFTWQREGWYAIFPFLAMFFSTLSCGFLNPFHVRLMNFLVVPNWFTYNVIHLSLAGIATEIFNFTSLVIGVFRIDIPRRIKERKQRLEPLNTEITEGISSVNSKSADNEKR